MITEFAKIAGLPEAEILGDHRRQPWNKVKHINN